MAVAGVRGGMATRYLNVAGIMDKIQKMIMAVMEAKV